MELSDKQCEELAEVVMRFSGSAPQPYKSMIPQRILKRQITNAIKSDKKNILEENLIPFHKWFHDNNIPSELDG